MNRTLSARLSLASAMALVACRGPAAGTEGASAIGSRSPAPTDEAVAGDGAPLPAASCPPRPACDTPPPPPGPRRPFRHTSSSLATVGEPRHRGRDLFVGPGRRPWAIAKFAYGPQDKDLEDEDVDVYLLRGCDATWEKIGTYRTSDDDTAHPTTEGIVDHGGRVYVDLATRRPLEVGRHRVHMVVAGDGSSADLFLEVLPPGARVAVSDVDGTLTSSEMAMLGDLVGGGPPAAHPGGADTMKALSDSGHYLFYLTARPEWLVDRTRAWLRLRRFPPGILHTTIGLTGAMGSAAAEFKSIELAWLKVSAGVVPSFAFGNKPSDVQTYVAAGIPASQCYYYNLAGDPRGGVLHNDYLRIATAISILPVICP